MGINQTSQGNQCIKDMSYKSFCGGYGGAWFTLGGLCLRARQGMCIFDKKLSGFTWIKFLGGTITLMPGWDVSYLFRWQDHHGSSEEHNKERKWNTPGVLLNQKGTIAVMAKQHTNCCKFKKIRIRRPPGWSLNWVDIDTFYDTLLGGYFWTVFDPWNPVGARPVNDQGEAKDKPSEQDKESKMSYKNKWWNEKTCSNNNDPLPLWCNRKCYNKLWNDDEKGWNWWNIVVGTGQNWWTNSPPLYAPFLPPVIPTSKTNTLWFRYKFYFKLAGRTIQSHVPDWPITEIDNPPGDTCKITNCKTCIQPEDLDEDGILTERALRRITGTNQRQQKRLQELLKKLLKSRRKRVHWGYEEWRDHTGQRNRYGL